MQPKDDRNRPQGIAPAQLSSMDNLLRALRSTIPASIRSSFISGKVSADKNRLKDDSFDLDLTYITDRIMAMSFPADGYEKAYRNDIDEVAAFLQSKHHHRFLIFNLSERLYEYAKFDNQVQDWCGFPDHHAPPLAVLFTMHAWLSVDPTNVVVVHCLAGKGRTGLIIACFMVFCGLFPNAEEALNFFALKRSTTNWGVTGPSQRRYAQYFSEIIERSIQPTVRPLRIRGITLVSIPRFGLGFAGQGVCPIFEVWDVSAPRKRMLYTSERPDTEPRSYPISMRSIHFGLDCVVWADVFIVFKHVTTFYGTELMFRFNFHTSMINSGELVLKRHEIDEADSDKRYQPDFSVTLQFADLTDEDRGKFRSSVDYDPALWGLPDKREPQVCWLGGDLAEKISQARMLASSKSKSAQKSGYLNKMGQQHKAWKRRWFVLKDGVLSYYIKPRDTTPKGKIPIEAVWSVQPAEDPTMPFCFEIVTLKKTTLIASDSKQDVSDWISSILYARHVMLGGRPAQVGNVKIRIVEALDVGPVPADAQGFQCEVVVQEHKSTTSIMRPPLTWNQELGMPLSQEEVHGEILITLWLMRPGAPQTYYGEVHVPVSALQDEHGAAAKYYKLEKRRACTHPITGRLSLAFNLSLDVFAPPAAFVTGTSLPDQPTLQDTPFDLRRSNPSVASPRSVSPRPGQSMSLSIVQSGRSPSPVPLLVSPAGSPNPRTWHLPQRSLPLPPLPATAHAALSAIAPPMTAILAPTPVPPPTVPPSSFPPLPSVPTTAPVIAGGSLHPYNGSTAIFASSSSPPTATPSIHPPSASNSPTLASSTSPSPPPTHIVQSVPTTSPLSSLLPSPVPPSSAPPIEIEPVPVWEPVISTTPLTDAPPGSRPGSMATDAALSMLAALSEEMPALAVAMQEKNHLVLPTLPHSSNPPHTPPTAMPFTGTDAGTDKLTAGAGKWHLPARSSSTGISTTPTPNPMLGRASGTPVNP